MLLFHAAAMRRMLLRLRERAPVRALPPFVCLFSFAPPLCRHTLLVCARAASLPAAARCQRVQQAAARHAALGRSNRRQEKRHAALHGR
jgi:hypothetical protein